MYYYIYLSELLKKMKDQLMKMDPINVCIYIYVINPIYIYIYMDGICMVMVMMMYNQPH